MATEEKHRASRSQGSTENLVCDIAPSNGPGGVELDDEMLKRVTGGEPPDPCRK